MCDKRFISSRVIWGSALVEISDDSKDSRSRGTEEEKFTILSPYENLWVVDAMSLSLRKDENQLYAKTTIYSF